MRKRRPWGRIVRRVMFLGFVLIGVVVGMYWWRASRFDMKEVEQMKERSTVFDMDGKPWGRLQGENRLVVKLDEVSKNFVAALLAREDTRFFSHWGVDPRGIARAIWKTAIGQKQGGSTLTQQLARNSYTEIGREKTIDRKLLELFVALRIERAYTKEAILENYMNRIYLGPGVNGIEMASKVYFNKPAKDLSLGEAAMIAGIIRAPSHASPFVNAKRAEAERNSVLDRLASGDCDGLRESYGVTLKAIEEARRTPLKYAVRKGISTQENYAMDVVMRELDSLLDVEQLNTGGLRIYTTIDPVLQEEAQKALDRVLTKIEQRTGYAHPKKTEFSAEARKAELPTDYLQGSVVIVDHRTGGIRALVGGRDYRESKFNRAIDAKRTIGSTVKPFVYAAAYERGLSPRSQISDGPIQAGEIDGALGWRPSNSDSQFRGMLPAEDGLVLSRNTMTVRVGNYAGVERVGKFAELAGLGEIPSNPQSYIGNFGATPRDVTLAYSVFANAGLKRQGYVIERIDDADGEMIYRAAHASHRVCEPRIAQMTASGLTQVFERGTAASAKSLGWGKPAAGKTGTTDDYHDAWFVGFTSSLTCGVWVGLDKPATIVPRGYGATVALPVWVEVMKKAPENKYPAAAFGLPGGGLGEGISRAIPRAEPIEPEDEGGGLRGPQREPESGGGLFRRFFGGK